MTEQVEVVDNNNNNNLDVPHEIDYKAWYEEHVEKIKSFDAIVAKKEELLKETRQAKAERDTIREKTLREVEQEQNELREKLNKLHLDSRNERLEVAALKLSNELAEGDNVELLSEFVRKNLSSLADEDGRLSKEVLIDVKKEFETNSKYKSLLKTSKAVGGGATGNMSSAQLQTDLNKLSPVDRINAVRSGKK